MAVFFPNSSDFSNHLNELSWEKEQSYNRIGEWKKLSRPFEIVMLEIPSFFSTSFSYFERSFPKISCMLMLYVNENTVEIEFSVFFYLLLSIVWKELTVFKLKWNASCFLSLSFDIQEYIYIFRMYPCDITLLVLNRYDILFRHGQCILAYSIEKRKFFIRQSFLNKNRDKKNLSFFFFRCFASK